MPQIVSMSSGRVIHPFGWLYIYRPSLTETTVIKVVDTVILPRLHVILWSYMHYSSNTTYLLQKIDNVLGQ